MAISASYVKFAGKNWYLIILLWIVVMIVGALHGPSFFNNTDDVMPETANTPSAEANDIMRKFFPASIDYTPWVLVIQCPEKETTPALLVEETGPFMSPAEDTVMKGCDGADGKPVISKDIKHMVDEIQQTLFDRNPDTFEPLLTVSYWSLAQSEYTKLLPRFLSEDGRTTYVQWSAKKSVFSSIRQKGMVYLSYNAIRGLNSTHYSTTYLCLFCLPLILLFLWFALFILFSGCIHTSHITHYTFHIIYNITTHYTTSFIPYSILLHPQKHHPKIQTAICSIRICLCHWW